jgi:hypothetical protein
MKIAQEELGKPLAKQLEDNQLATQVKNHLKGDIIVRNHVHQNHITQQLKF